MNKAYIDGFIKRAQEAGFSPAQASQMLKEATGLDPSQLGAGGPGGDPSQGGGMPPQGGDPSQQGMPDASGGLGVPPEIEQLIQQLPPEVLQQLVQEIEAELANGGQGGGDPSMQGGDPSQGGGMPPQGGGMPMDPSMGKQGSVKILAKEASYIEGFVERALSYGFTRNDAKEMYKKALDIMAPEQPVQQKTTVKQASDKQAAHFDGFMQQARAYGISDVEAANVYNQTFRK